MSNKKKVAAPQNAVIRKETTLLEILRQLRQKPVLEFIEEKDVCSLLGINREDLRELRFEYYINHPKFRVGNKVYYSSYNLLVNLIDIYLGDEKNVYWVKELFPFA